MKKLMFALVAAGAAAVMGEEIASQNVVGYTTLDITKSYSILAINFQDANNGGELAIQDAFPYASGMTTGGSSSASDSIQVMDDDGNYAFYYISNGKAGKASYPATSNKWVKVGSVSTPTTDTLKSGKAFWYVSKAFVDDANATPYSIQVAGQVMAASADTKEIAQQYMLVGNPYPIEIPLNNGVVVTKGLTLGGSSSAADSLQIMDDQGNYVFYYMSNGSAGKASYPATSNKWVKVGSVSTPTTDSFPVGRGGWFVSKTGNTALQFVKPAAAE